MALYAFDGTWNSATLNDDVEQDNETNVARFSEAYTDSKWYISGPGTRFEDVGRVLGGAFGAGGPERVKEAYRQLCQNWVQSDHIIDIIGFSRGAALALDFANKTEEDKLHAIPMTALLPRDAGRTGQPVPSSRLEVGQYVEKAVLAQHCWNTVGIAVKKGERYDVTATGTWKDKDHESTAAGDPAPNWFMRRFEGTKRVAQAPWFCLIAAVHPSHTLEFQHSDTTNGLTDLVVETLGRAVKKRDAESQLVSVGAQSSIAVDRNGYLYLFANDAAWAYDNNSGAIKATIERQQ